MEEDKLLESASRVDCEIEGWTSKYLGLSLTRNPNMVEFWDPVLKKVERKLDGLKGECLSTGGRL